MQTVTVKYLHIKRSSMLTYYLDETFEKQI